jgi:hypothetical protein
MNKTPRTLRSSGCVICKKRLAGRQRKYCSRRCKNQDTNHRHQSYLSQQMRGLQRKIDLIITAGGKCSRCGYDRNHAALTWHHKDPALKGFSLDLRSLSNRSQRAINDEIAKCILLCANCHAEEHFPQFDKGFSRNP